MTGHLQLTADGRQEAIVGPLAASPQPVSPPDRLFAFPSSPAGSLAFDLDDGPTREPMRAAHDVRRMRHRQIPVETATRATEDQIRDACERQTDADPPTERNRP